MTDDSDIEVRALADSLVGYANAIVALSVVGVSGLAIALADPDVLETVAKAANYVIVTNVLTGFGMSGLVILLRRWEVDLRSELPPAPKARKYARYLHIARIFVVWLASTQAILLMLVIR